MKLYNQNPGYATITDEYGKVTEADTYHCVHCQMLLHIRPGSGVERGFCVHCEGITCGKPECNNRCVPFMQKIEAMENRHRLHKAMERGYDR